MEKQVKIVNDFKETLVRKKFRDVCCELDCDYDNFVFISINDIDYIIGIMHNYYVEHNIVSSFIRKMFDFINVLREDAINLRFQVDINFILYELEINKDKFIIDNDFSILDKLYEHYGRKEENDDERGKCYHKL